MLKMLLIGALAATTPQQTDTTVAVRPGGSLQLENRQGSVTVRTWDRSELRVRARHDGQARVRIDATGRPASDIRVESDGWRRGGVRTIDYEVTVPRRFSVNLEGVSLRIDVADLEGDVGAESINGAVTVRGVNGDIRIEAMQSRVTVTSSRGSLSAEGTNESIQVDGFEGDIAVDNVNGNLILTGISARRVTAETVNGRVEFSGTLHADGRYALSTHNGDVILGVPDGTNATIEIETFLGSIDAEFPVEMRRSGRNRASFAIGDGGGARVSIESFGGPIRIRRVR